MAKVLVTDSYLTAIGDAIREKSGSSIQYTPAEMADAIMSIPTGSGTGAEDAFITGAYTGIYTNNRVSKVGSTLFASQPYITRVELPEVTQIVDNAFSKSSITEIYLPKVNKLGKSTFLGCSNLTTVEMPVLTNSVGNATFENCTALKSISLPMLTKITQEMFYGCTALVNVDLPMATGSIPYWAFRGCTSLKTINLPSITEANASTADGYQFCDCTKLISVNLPLAEGQVSDHMFQNCSALTTVNLPKATGIDIYGFSGCGFTEINTAMFPNVTSFNYCAFANCAKLTKFVSKHSLTTLPNRAFYGCDNLKLVDFSRKVSLVTATFADCPGLVAAVFRNGFSGAVNATSGTDYKCTAFDKYTSTNAACPIDESAGGYVYIPRAMMSETFYANIKNITFRAIEDYTVDGTINGELDLVKMGLEAN